MEHNGLSQQARTLSSCSTIPHDIVQSPFRSMITHHD